MPHAVLIVDDLARLAEVLAVALSAQGFDARTVHSVEEAEAALKQDRFDLVLTDLKMPGLTGRDLLHRLRESRPDIPVIVMTAYASVRDAVDLVKEGAFDYISKPFEIDDVVATIRRALNLREAIEENERLRGELEERYSFDQLIGSSPPFQQVLQQITEVCRSRATVLLQGESGTGKELAARAIHFNSPRRQKPFVAVNCAAIPEALLESELFGHAKGAFTGATSARDGRFVAADGGTLFLDEIGDMPLPVQAKVLRAIQEQAFEPVGGDRTVSVDVRIVAATHRDLKAMIAERTFREDLYYRLNVFPIALPALRERRGDIVVLAQTFLRAAADDMAKKIVGFSPAAEAALNDYSWPGNIRELQNCVERAAIVGRGTVIDVPDLPRYILEPAAKALSEPGLPIDLDAELERVERSFIVRALRETGGVQVKAAALLKIGERSFWHRLKKLGIRVDRNVE